MGRKRANHEKTLSLSRGVQDRVRTYKTKDGKKKEVHYLYVYYNGRYNATGLKNTPANRIKAQQIYAAHHSSEVVPNVYMTVSEAIEYYLATNKHLRSIDSIKHRLRRIEPYVGKYKLDEISVMGRKPLKDAIHAFASDNKYSFRSIKDSISALHRVFAVLCEEDIIYRNPLDNMNYGTAYYDKKNIHNYELENREDTFEPGELEYFFDLLEEYIKKCKKRDRQYENTNYTIRAFFQLVAFYGLRRSEALGLKWDAIDFERHEMRLFRARTKEGTHGLKSASSYRTCILTDEWVTILKTLKNIETDNQKIFRRAYHQNDYVFKKISGELYDVDYFSKLFTKVIRLDESGVFNEDTHLHSLRASFTTILIDNGVSIEDVSTMLGHADISTTLRYYVRKRKLGSARRIVETMKNLFSLKK